jgi:hypothetical protein
LPEDYTDAVVGIKYKFEIATMPIEAGQNSATAQLGIKRVDKAMVRTSQCESIEVSTDGYNYENVEVESNRAVLAVTGNPEYDHRIFIRHEDVGPCTINNITVRGVSNDG